MAQSHVIRRRSCSYEGSPPQVCGRLMVSTLPNVCTLLLRMSCATDTPVTSAPAPVLSFPPASLAQQGHPCQLSHLLHPVWYFLTASVSFWKTLMGVQVFHSHQHHVAMCILCYSLSPRRMGLDFLSPGTLLPTRSKAAFRYSGSVRASAVLGQIASLQGTLKHADS